MREMAKGSNVGLAALSDDTGSVVVSLRWSSAAGDGDADVSVLLLDGNGKVRSDADFFFYNNPAAADGSVQLLGKTPTDSGSEDRISLDLTAVPEDVDRIVVAASQYGGSCFGELDDLRVTLADGSGEALLGFSITDAGVESAFIFGELYRRGEEWKFRAIGQGYETGLAGLATDFGIDIDEESDDESEDDAVAAAAVEHVPKADESRPPAALPSAAIPAQAVREAQPVGVEPTTKRSRGPRTAKKKVTLPKVVKKSLAENDSWRPARLFPAPSLKSDKERELRATSVLLSVMAEVPELGRRLTAAFGAPAGRMQTFTEVTLPHGDSPKRPDGVIRVERAGKLWTALVETKTNGNPLKPDQVQNYMDIAARRGYEAVITLSNDVALEGSPLVDVKIDGRRRNKVALWHLSWAEVAHQAQMLIRHEGVGNAAHAWPCRNCCTISSTRTPAATVFRTWDRHGCRYGTASTRKLFARAIRVPWRSSRAGNGSSARSACAWAANSARRPCRYSAPSAVPTPSPGAPYSPTGCATKAAWPLSCASTERRGSSGLRPTCGQPDFAHPSKSRPRKGVIPSPRPSAYSDCWPRRRRTSMSRPLSRAAAARAAPWSGCALNPPTCCPRTAPG